MKYSVVIRPVTVANELTVLRDILGDARDDDIREWETAGDMPFAHSLRLALSRTNVWTADLDMDGVTVTSLLAFGVFGMNAWLVATNEAVQHYRSLRRVFPQGLELMLSVSPTLYAYADSRNILHHRWMEVMGFEAWQYFNLLIGEVPFHLYKYEKETQQVCASPS